ncbi:MAG TPA: transglycosylase SLT domain-containing protein [Thermoanaerobaculia bacterium]|jgi:soluble lytic murein transglycosylase|nr:transglycosylase SLT domain-containing protein [Thermoanaerobaculia bacterium]
MFGTITLALAVTVVADPRPELVELQLAGQQRQARARVEQELAERPEPSRRLGLSYLYGHLLDGAGKLSEASQAFVNAIGETPTLQLYSRYRAALDLDRMGHPEMAAGLVATVPASDPKSPLIPEAVRLFVHTLNEGGDCQLLRGVRPEALPSPQRREIQLAQGDCALRTDYPELARSLLASLLAENRTDEPARGAADRLTRLVSQAERGRLPMLIGFTFHQHGDFDRALRHLQQANGRGDALSGRDAYETQHMIGLAMLSQQRYTDAALAFARLATLAKTPADRARALYEEGLAHELRSAWPLSAARFRQAYLAEPQGREWAAPALLSGLRLEWRGGAEAGALKLYQRLTERPEWRSEAARAALFLAASDLVRGRHDRARPWLDQALLGGREDRIDASYWSGRLAELEHNRRGAVARYLEVLRADPHHPLARAAQARLAAEALARTAAAEGRSLASSRNVDDVYGAWLLLGGEDAAGKTAQRKLEQMLLADRSAAPYLRLSEVPVRRWPLWKAEVSTPEEMLLGLGIWHEGAPAVGRHFPLSDPALGFTGGVLLARGGDIARSIAIAEALRSRAPGRLPLALQPAAYRRLLYPFPYQEALIAQGRIRSVDVYLLAALIREESRFDTSALSPAASRGLTRLSLSTARRVAEQLNLQRFAPGDLYRPEVSIALGAAYLGALLKDFGGAAIPAIAAYDAGENQAMVWRSQCFSQEPEEYFTKIGRRETRDYTARVLAGRAQYADLY